MFDSLGSFDRGVAERLFTIHPEWLTFARTEKDCEENALIVSLVCPNPRIDMPLVITTEEREVSVFFDSYHAHFNELNDDVLALVDNLMSDHHCVASFWRDEQWCGSLICENSALPKSNEEYPYANKILIRSWSGEIDDELACVGRD